MTIHFCTWEVYHTRKYDGKNDPNIHLEEFQTLGVAQPKDEWVHAFINTLDEMSRSWYVSAELRTEITTY